MPTPRISSELRNEAAAPDQNNAPTGRRIMIVGPAGKGPTTPQSINEPGQAYSLYGTDGSLADDVALALRGANIGAAQADSNEVGQVIAIRADAGRPATLDLKSGGSVVMTLRTDASGTQANNWTATPNANSLEIFDPENNENYTFSFDPSGADSAIRTPSDLAQAIAEQTNGRLFADVERAHAHFEFTFGANTDLSSNELAYDSSDAQTTLDLSDATISDMEALTTETSTRIGGDTNYFETGNNPSDAIHNRIIPEDQDNVRAYTISSGAATVLPSDQQEQTLDYLADSNRVFTGTDSLLNVSTTSGTLTDAAQRNASTVSEAWERVREHFVGRLDTSDTEALTDASWAEYDVTEATDLNGNDPANYLGSSGSDVGAELDSTPTDGDHILIVTHDDQDGIYQLETDDGGSTHYLRNTRVVTGVTLSSNGDGVNVADAIGGNLTGNYEGTKVYIYDSAEGDIEAAKRVQFDFEAPHGIADEDGSGDAGSLAVDYAEWLTGQSLTATDELAKDLSVNRLLPEDVEDKFEDTDDGPLKVFLAPVTDPNNAEEFDGDYVVESWSDGTATIDLDAAELEAEYDDALVYISYDSCVFDLYEQDSRSDLSEDTDYTVDGQTLVFGQPTSHQTVVRPLRITQYEWGEDLEIRRNSGGNEFVYEGRGNQPGPGGDEVGNIETIWGFEYDFEPDFPAPSTRKSLNGSTSGINAREQVKARALDQALRQHGKRDHEFILASGLHVDAMQGGKDPVTGDKVNEPVGVLRVLERHQQRQIETGASPIIYAAVKPMEPSNVTGRYTNEQKRRRVQELTEPSGNNAASIINSKTRPEAFIFDAPYSSSVGGRTITTSSPALWAGIRSTLPNTAALYEIDLAGAVTPKYKYDVAGAGMPSSLSDGNVNTWDPRRNSASLADERTAAKKVVGPNDELVETGFKSGVALLAAKEFQHDAVDQLENMLGPVPSGGIEVLRGTVETQLSGIANRTSGIQELIFSPQRDITIRSEGGNSLGMAIDLTLQVNGELRTITLTVGAVNSATQQQGDDSAIPTAQ